MPSSAHSTTSSGISTCATQRVLPDRDFVLRWQPKPQAQPNVASFAQDIDGSHYAMLMLLPPQQQARRLPRELILVIDTSGSMGGESIRQARAALDLALTPAAAAGPLQRGRIQLRSSTRGVATPLRPRPTPCSEARAVGRPAAGPRRHRDGAGAAFCARRPRSGRLCAAGAVCHRRRGRRPQRPDAASSTSSWVIRACFRSASAARRTPASCRRPPAMAAAARR